MARCTAFSPASADGGTATATFTASPSTPVGVYTLTITATNDDGSAPDGDVLGERRRLPRSGVRRGRHSSTTSRAAAREPAHGQDVTIEGVVVGDYQGPGQFGGYYVQEEDADADADPPTSEGIFVFNTTTPSPR